MDEQAFDIDDYAPARIAQMVEVEGVRKTNQDLTTMFGLAFLGGCFIALGCEFFTIVTAGNPEIGFGLNSLIGGLAFCLGLILVIVAGAELFASNNLIVMALVSKKVFLDGMFLNWMVTYIGNFTGAIATATVMYLTRVWELGDYAVGANALNIAIDKVSMGFIPLLARGMMANGLICVAVWLCFSARSVVSKIFAILFPTAAFVASGFELSVANMYFIPIGLFLKGISLVSSAAGAAPSDLAMLNLEGFLVRNLIPVTIGNILGGTVMVGVIYWVIYLRKWVYYESTYTKR